MNGSRLRRKILVKASVFGDSVKKQGQEPFESQKEL